MPALCGVSVKVEASTEDDRVLFSIETSDEEALTGKDGEVLEALQHLVKLAIAKKYKENLKLLLDVNDFRERRKKDDHRDGKKTCRQGERKGKPIKTKPLNPYERRIIHTLFKNNNRISTHSEGDGHTKKVVISPSGSMNARR